MTNLRLTASSLWRRELCPASAVLPESPRRKYADAEHGKAEHAKAEAAPPPGAEAEVAYALNVLSGQARKLEAKNREYGELAEGEIPGTADRVYVMDDHVLVEDLKTGVGYMQAPPPINCQLQHNGLCAALVHGKPRAIVQLLYTSRPDKTGDAEFDLFDFPAILLRLRRIWEAVRDARSAWERGGAQELLTDGFVVYGDACWRCGCRKFCPLMGKQRKTA